MNKKLFIIVFTVLTAMMVPMGAVIALSGITVGSIRFLIDVEEPIHCIPVCDDGITIELNLFPGEEHVEEIEIFNKSEKNLDVMLTPHLEPDGDGIEVEIPDDMFLVPGEGSITKFIIITASARVEAQRYNLTIQVERGDY